MNCRDVQKSLTEDLLSQNLGEIRRHLQECGSCQDFCSDLLKLQDWTRELSEAVRTPAGFQDSVMEDLNRQLRFRRRALRPLIAVSVLLALSGGFFWASRDGRPDDSAGPYFQIRSVDAHESPNQIYLDVVLDPPDGEGYILRLPSVIEVRRTELHEEVYLQNASH